MKKLHLIAIVIISGWLGLATANAQVSGTLTGRIRTTDNRAARQTGSPAAEGDLVGVGRVIVAVTAVGQNDRVNSTRFAVTDANGNFTVKWRDRSRKSFPVPLRIRVVWAQSNSAGGGTRVPRAVFRIRRAGAGRSEESAVEVTADAATSDLGNIDIAPSDETAAYLTTREFFHRVIGSADILIGRMRGLVVRTRVSNFNYLFQVAPSSREVLINENTPATNPAVLAHELGHAINWAALGVKQAPINPAKDYSNPRGTPMGWKPTSREYSKAAFQEGLADAWALEWQFGSNTRAMITAEGQVFNYEAKTVTDATSGAVVLDCRTVANADEFPFCQAAAIRDLLDKDEGEGDGVDLNRSFIVYTLDRFVVGYDNGERDERGADGLNHHDFRCNSAGSRYRRRVRSVWRGAGINGGPGSFCSR